MTKKIKSQVHSLAPYDGEIARSLTEKLDDGAIQARKLGIALLGLSQDQLITALAVTGALLDVALQSSELLRERVHAEENLSDVSFALLRQIDTFGQRGKKVIEGAKKGHSTVHGTPAEKQERYDHYQAAADAVFASNSAQSWSAVCERVSKKFGVSAKTISRHTRQKV